MRCADHQVQLQWKYNAIEPPSRQERQDQGRGLLTAKHGIEPIDCSQWVVWIINMMR